MAQPSAIRALRQQLKRVPHLLVECPEMIPSVRLGVLDTLRLLEAEEKCEVRFVRTIELHRKDLDWCDVFITVRGSESITLEVAQLLKEAKRRILYFLDDDLLHIPEGIASTPYYKDKGIRENIRNLIGLSDRFWCVNPRIAAEYGPLGNGDVFLGKVPATLPVTLLAHHAKADGAEHHAPSDGQECHPHADEPDDRPHTGGPDDHPRSGEPIHHNQPGEPDRGPGPVKILYAGSVDHFTAVRSYILPAVEKLCEKYGERVSMTYIGVDPGPSKCPNVRHYSYFDDYDAYRRFVEEERFEIGLAPIFTTGFYQSKFHNKYIEYSTIGAMGIYTDADPYKSVIRDGWNGLLTENTVEAWTATLEKAVVSAALRHACIHNAIVQMEAEYRPEAVAAEVEAALPELTTYLAPRARIRYGVISLSKVRNLLRRGWLIFKNNGWRGFPILMGKIRTKSVKRLAVMLDKASDRLHRRVA